MFLCSLCFFLLEYLVFFCCAVVVMSRCVLVSAAYDQQIRFFDVSSFCPAASFEVLDTQVNCLHLCGENRYLVMGGFCVIRVFDLAKGAGAGELESRRVPSGKFTPVLVAKHEAVGPVNFSSLGSFWMRKERGSFVAFSVGGVSQDESVPDLWGTNSMGFSSFCDGELGMVLFATGEDGSIRFFDFCLNSKELVVLKFIRTGAAVTCSALSPDFRFLLTGSQIGQVSVWHLPSIMIRCIFENRRRALPHLSSSLNEVAPCAPVNATTAVYKNGGNNIIAGNGQGKDAHGNALQHTAVYSNAPSARDKKNRNEVGLNSIVSEDQRKEEELFGSKPLQIISFPNDYSAVRSLAISSVGWWGAVAMHCGNLHFIGISKFASSDHPHKVNTSTSSSSVAQGTPRGSTDPCSPAVAATGKPSNLAQGGTETNASFTREPLVAHEGETAPKRENENSVLSSGIPRMRVSTNATAVEATTNPRSSMAEYSLGVGTQADAEENIIERQTSSACPHNHLSRENSKFSPDEAAANAELKLLRGLEGQKKGQGKWETDVGDDKGIDSELGNSQTNAFAPGGAAQVQVQKNKIQAEFQMEVLHSIQAHHKCILKVVIAPNNSMLVTCSADFTVGRFLIPKDLQTWRMTPQQKSTAEGDGKQGVKNLSSQKLPQLSASELSELPDSKMTAADKPNKDGAAVFENDNPSAPSQDSKESQGSAPSTSSSKPALKTSSEPSEGCKASISTPNGGVTTKEEAVQGGLESKLPDSLTKKTLYLNEEAAAGKQSGLQSSGDDTPYKLEDPSSTDPRRESRVGPSGLLPVEGQQQVSSVPSPFRFSSLQPLIGHSRWVWDAVFSECSSFLFTASSDASIRVWNLVSDTKDDSPKSDTVELHKKPVTTLLLYTERRKNK